ncbi:MAG TPA: DNA repair protein RecN [Pseudomonadales bacterium]|nr:DNA repair protein RecN [Pseudomonadales bacterium]
MLTRLTVRDFALVRAVDVTFERGLTVLTGESGAGKSILLGALGLALGDRAAAASVRPSAERSDVTAEFDVDGNLRATDFLTSRGLDDPDASNRCVLRRIINREGRSRAYINGAPATSNDLTELAATLIDIHGQNEHQSLLRRDVQLDLLDHYAGAEALAARVRDAYRTWRSAADTLHTLQTNDEQSRDRRTLLEYQLGELSELAVSPGEYQELHDRYRRMSKSQDIQMRIGTALGVLEGESESGVADVARIVTLLSGIDDGHASLAGARELLDTALTHLDETSRELRRYLEDLTSAPDELERIEARLDRITELARKHRLRPEMLAERHSDLTAELSSLRVSDQDLDAVRQKMLDAEQTFRTAGTELSNKRRRAAKKFAREVSMHIDSLGITGGSLELVFSDAEHDGGLDSVEYHIVTNPKYPAAPLARIASGGERSRVSLAIQVVAAEKSKLPALILDEADVGIGGTTADVVGRLLRRLAARTQVLCVTHAPQVAARGEHHLLISKSSEYDTVVEPLDSAGRIAELARMLGGQDITKKTIEYAEELISAGAL